MQNITVHRMQQLSRRQQFLTWSISVHKWMLSLIYCTVVNTVNLLRWTCISYSWQVFLQLRHLIIVQAKKKNNCAGNTKCNNLLSGMLVKFCNINKIKSIFIHMNKMNKFNTFLDGYNMNPGRHVSREVFIIPIYS
jgi:hypothetical protein